MKEKFPQKTGRVIWGNFFMSQQITQRCFQNIKSTLVRITFYLAFFQKHVLILSKTEAFTGKQPCNLSRIRYN